MYRFCKAYIMTVMSDDVSRCSVTCCRLFVVVAASCRSVRVQSTTGEMSRRVERMSNERNSPAGEISWWYDVCNRYLVDCWCCRNHHQPGCRWILFTLPPVHHRTIKHSCNNFNGFFSQCCWWECMDSLPLTTLCPCTWRRHLHLCRDAAVTDVAMSKGN